MDLPQYYSCLYQCLVLSLRCQRLVFESTHVIQITGIVMQIKFENIPILESSSHFKGRVG